VETGTFPNFFRSVLQDVVWSIPRTFLSPDSAASSGRYRRGFPFFILVSPFHSSPSLSRQNAIALSFPSFPQMALPLCKSIKTFARPICSFVCCGQIIFSSSWCSRLPFLVPRNHPVSKAVVMVCFTAFFVFRPNFILVVSRFRS